MSRPHLLVVSFLVAFGAALAAPPTLAQPILSLEESAAVISGLAPGGEAAVIGVGSAHTGFQPVETAMWEVVTADAAGTARLEVLTGVPTYSVWAAIDLGTGELALAAPAGTALHEVPFPARALPATRRSLDDGRSGLYVLWARPVSVDTDGGAWAGVVLDGSGRDGDGAQNRRLQVLLDQLEPLGASGLPPAALAAGDAVVGIDPASLEIYAARLTD